MAGDAKDKDKDKHHDKDKHKDADKDKDKDKDKHKKKDKDEGGDKGKDKSKDKKKNKDGDKGKDKSKDKKREKDKDDKKDKSKDKDDKKDKSKDKDHRKDSKGKDDRGKDKRRESKSGRKGSKSSKKDGKNKKGDKKKDTKKRKPEVVEENPHLKFNPRLYKAFRPLRHILIWFGRYPFQKTVNSNTSITYTSHNKSIGKWYFLAVTVFTFYILITGTIDLFGVSISRLVDRKRNVSSFGSDRRRNATIDESNHHLYEKVLLERHFIILIVIAVSLMHNAIVGVVVHWKRKYIATYMGLWTRAVLTMHMDLGRGLTGYCFGIAVIFFVLIFSLVALSVLDIGPTTRGSPALLALLMFRIFEPNLLSQAESEVTVRSFEAYLVFGGIVILFVFAASKAYVLFFLAHCKLLRNAFGTWNGRIYAAVLRGGDFAQTPEGRTTYKILYKDHCLLLDLMEGTNVVFSTIIESYYGLQIFSLCFEIYFVLRTITSGDNQVDAIKDNYFVRQYDFAPGLIILTMNIWIIFTISTIAAEVGEEAIAGLEVLRRKTMLGRKTDEELYFMLSMYSSYTAYAKLEICGGGYFYLNKEFIIGIIGTIASYFIIIYQFQPTLDYKSEDDDERKLIGEFLSKLEGLLNCHWDLNCTDAP